MSGAPERKYTDADVRADPELTEMVYDYLDKYAGEYDPLVRAQSVLKRGSYLTTAQTRVVLNCMRHDWDIADQMPAPMAQVIDMPQRDETEVYGYMQPTKKKGKKRQQTRGYLGPQECGSTELHMAHNWNDETFPDAYWHCGGKNNGREGYLFIDAKIKTPYVKATGGRMVHLLGEGSYFHWVPNVHGDGYGGMLRQIGQSEADKSLWGRFPPHLHVKVLCKHPSWLTDPFLLWEIPDGLITNDGQPIGLCKYCKEVRDSDNPSDA
jgi:hypothetical protein